MSVRKVNNLSDAASNNAQRSADAKVDGELVDAAKNGDQSAFAKLVEKYQRFAFCVANGMVRDQSDAREIVQEAFLRIYRGLSTFQGECSFFTWLYKVVTNLSIDQLRRSARRDIECRDEVDVSRCCAECGDIEPFVSRFDGADPFRSIRRREIAERLDKALSELSPKHLAVILMREVEGMSYSEIAESVGVSSGTVMSRLFNARQKLQCALRDCYDEENQSSRANRTSRESMKNESKH